MLVKSRTLLALPHCLRIAVLLVIEWWRRDHRLERHICFCLRVPLAMPSDRWPLKEKKRKDQNQLYSTLLLGAVHITADCKNGLSNGHSSIKMFFFSPVWHYPRPPQIVAREMKQSNKSYFFLCFPPLSFKWNQHTDLGCYSDTHLNRIPKAPIKIPPKNSDQDTGCDRAVFFRPFSAVWQPILMIVVGLFGTLRTLLSPHSPVKTTTNEARPLIRYLIRYRNSGLNRYACVCMCIREKPQLPKRSNHFPLLPPFFLNTNNPPFLSREWALVFRCNTTPLCCELSGLELVKSLMVTHSLVLSRGVKVTSFLQFLTLLWTE